MTSVWPRSPARGVGPAEGRVGPGVARSWDLHAAGGSDVHLAEDEQERRDGLERRGDGDPDAIARQAGVVGDGDAR